MVQKEKQNRHEHVPCILPKHSFLFEQQQQKKIKHFSPWVASCIFTTSPVQCLHVRVGGRAVLHLLIPLIWFHLSFRPSNHRLQNHLVGKRKVESVVQSAALRIFSIVTPLLKAIVAESPLAEWAFQFILKPSKWSICRSICNWDISSWGDWTIDTMLSRYVTILNCLCWIKSRIGFSTSVNTRDTLLSLNRRQQNSYVWSCHLNLSRFHCAAEIGIHRYAFWGLLLPSSPLLQKILDQLWPFHLETLTFYKFVLSF